MIVLLEIEESIQAYMLGANEVGVGDEMRTDGQFEMWWVCGR